MNGSAKEPNAPIQKIGIVGLGLIGGSIGLALRDPARELIGYDVSPDAQKMAMSRMCVDRVGSIGEVSQAEVVFIAVPPATIIASAEMVLELKGKATVVTDCGSVKSEVAAWAENRLLPDFLGGHPMAGHEKGGAEFASAWMFRGARWILTPTEHTSSETTSAVEALVKIMGATPIQLKASDHDRHVAVLSHLPHAIAAILVLMAQDLEHLEVGAGSWRDATRVGGVDPVLWSQILGGNRLELIRVLSNFEERVRSLRTVLKEGDALTLERILEEAQLARLEQSARMSPGEEGPSPRRTLKAR